MTKQKTRTIKWPNENDRQ